MNPWTTAGALVAALALATTPAMADDADDLTEVARLQERLRAEVPKDLRVFSAEFGSSVRLLLRGKGLATQEARIESGSNWVQLEEASYFGLNCRGSGIAIGKFSIEAGMRTYFKARAIARELDAEDIPLDRISFSFKGPRCEPGWHTTLTAAGPRYINLEFGIDGRLRSVLQWEAGIDTALDVGTVKALDERAAAALPGQRVEAEPLAAEAEAAAPTGQAYLLATIGGRSLTCTEAELELSYDGYLLDLRCERVGEGSTLVLRVPGVTAAPSEHRMVENMAGPELWLHQGFVQMESDDQAGDTRIWLDAFNARLVEGRFEGTVSNASGRRVKITDGRFRLQPEGDFALPAP